MATHSTIKGAVAAYNAKVKKSLSDKEKRIRDYRREASRKVSIANKRIARLERNQVEDSPAYQRLVKDGGAHFSIRGKTFNQVQKEVARLDRFLESDTSTIRGINRTLRTMAANTGIKYKNLTELRSKASQFFELASKVEQYLRTVEDMASAIGYQKIWEAINQYTKESQSIIGDGQRSIDDMVKAVSKAIAERENALITTPVRASFYNLD